jgi:hypothetical protein
MGGRLRDNNSPQTELHSCGRVRTALRTVIRGHICTPYPALLELPDY